MEAIGNILIWSIAGGVSASPFIYGVWIMLSKWSGGWSSRLIRFALLDIGLAVTLMVGLLMLGIRREWETLAVATAASIVLAIMLILIGWAAIDAWRGDWIERIAFVLLAVLAFTVPAYVGALDGTDDARPRLLLVIGAFFIIGGGSGAWARKRRERREHASAHHG